MSRSLTSIMAIYLVTLVSGCSDQPETYLVHGMVVYPDGQPVPRGTVEFETMNGKLPITASGEIAPDGTFQLGTFAVDDGAIAGTHRVAVIANYEIGTGIERPGLLPPPVLNPKFSEFSTSGLEYTIKPSMNNILLEVEHAPPPQAEGEIGDALLETELGGPVE